jgi:hypothetical protein
MPLPHHAQSSKIPWQYKHDFFHTSWKNVSLIHKISILTHLISVFCVKMFVLICLFWCVFASLDRVFEQVVRGSQLANGNFLISRLKSQSLMILQSSAISNSPNLILSVVVCVLQILTVSMAK